MHGVRVFQCFLTTPMPATHSSVLKAAGALQGRLFTLSSSHPILSAARPTLPGHLSPSKLTFPASHSLKAPFSAMQSIRCLYILVHNNIYTL